MTIINNVTALCCDGMGCEAVEASLATRADDVRADAKPKGWTRGRNGGDLCPACSMLEAP